MAVKSSNQITVTDMTDAYGVFLDSESFTFNASDAGSISGSCTTNITARCGSNSVTVSVTQANIKFYEQGSSSEMANPPFNVTVTPGTGNLSTTITFTAKSGATLTTPVEAEIPISVDSSIDVTKKFSLSSAIAGTDGAAGAAGKGISSVVTYFQTNNSSTKPSAGTSSPWSTTPTAPSASNHYMWAYDYYTYTDSTHTSTAVRLAAEYTDASKWSTGTVLSGTGTNKTGVAGNVGDQYLNSTTGETYKCTTTGTASTAKWDYVGSIKGAPGAAGADGADAINISITTTNGTVFKNNTGSTKLTAHVFVGGVEQSIVENTGVCGTLGTVKWYKGLPGDTQPSGWPQSKGAITIAASDVTNAQAYTCQLEG